MARSMIYIKNLTNIRTVEISSRGKIIRVPPSKTVPISEEDLRNNEGAINRMCLKRLIQIETLVEMPIDPEKYELASDEDPPLVSVRRPKTFDENKDQDDKENDDKENEGTTPLYTKPNFSKMTKKSIINFVFRNDLGVEIDTKMAKPTILKLVRAAWRKKNAKTT